MPNLFDADQRHRDELVSDVTAPLSFDAGISMFLDGTAFRFPTVPEAQRVASRALTAVPLAVLRLTLDRIATEIARLHPALFARMGTHTHKRFLIDPLGLPFVFVMVPDTAAPRLTAYDRYEHPQHDAAVAGTFMRLLDMISGSLDGDALFFSRDLHVTGDIEAVVAMRNALDNFDGDLVQAILGALGPLSLPAGLAIALLRNTRRPPRRA